MGTSSRSAFRFTTWLLQSPPAEWALHQLHELTIGALRQGPIPQHVAFVMDGNRRFAKRNMMETVEGHNLGFEALARVLEICYRTGVKCVTIYAFSIENFKRSKHEVDALMEMARLRAEQLSQHGELLDRYGVSLRVLGQRELVSPEVMAAVDKAVNLTARNKQAVLNICFPYTSRDEIATAIRTTVEDFSMPPAKASPVKRQFNEHRIAQNIRSRKLSTVQEESQTAKALEPTCNGSTTEPLAASPPQHLNGDDEEASPTSSTYLDTSPSSPSASTPNTSDDHNDSSRRNSPSPSPHGSQTHENENDDDGDENKRRKDRAAPPPPPLPDPETITADTLTAHMFTAGSPPLDLLVRTSGVQRLSDFMLWQCHEHTSIVFLDCLWPEFGLWKFLPVLVGWQWGRMKEARGGMWGWAAKSPPASTIPSG